MNEIAANPVVEWPGAVADGSSSWIALSAAAFLCRSTCEGQLWLGPDISTTPRDIDAVAEGESATEMVAVRVECRQSRECSARVQVESAVYRRRMKAFLVETTYRLLTGEEVARGGSG